MQFNKNTISVLGNTDYIPHSEIVDVKHYPANILITTKNNGLFVTKTFTMNHSGLCGDFMPQPTSELTGNPMVPVQASGKVINYLHIDSVKMVRPSSKGTVIEATTGTFVTNKPIAVQEGVFGEFQPATTIPVQAFQQLDNLSRTDSPIENEFN